MATYPLPKFHFLVEWGGTRLGFTEVTGLDTQTDVIEYREGSSPEYSKIKMPGLKKFSNIVLKRGTVKADGDFYTWIDSTVMNTVDRRDITVKLLDETGAPLFTWKIQQAWPVKYQFSDLKSDGNEVAIETLELAHEGFHKV